MAAEDGKEGEAAARVPASKQQERAIAAGGRIWGPSSLESE